jgi:hypothetical protein
MNVCQSSGRFRSPATKMEAARRVLTVRRAYQGEVRAVAEQDLADWQVTPNDRQMGRPAGWVVNRP